MPDDSPLEKTLADLRQDATKAMTAIRNTAGLFHHAAFDDLVRTLDAVIVGIGKRLDAIDAQIGLAPAPGSAEPLTAKPAG